MSDTFKWCVNKTRLKTFNKQVFYIDRYGTRRWFLNGLGYSESDYWKELKK